jgi:hypothetical protein
LNVGDWNNRKDDVVVGLICAAFIFKGTLWLWMPKKITSLDISKKEATLISVKTLLMQNKFSEYIADWFCDNINHIDEQTLTLLEYLGAQVPDISLSKE